MHKLPNITQANIVPIVNTQNKFELKFDDTIYDIITAIDTKGVITITIIDTTTMSEYMTTLQSDCATIFDSKYDFYNYITEGIDTGAAFCYCHNSICYLTFKKMIPGTNEDEVSLSLTEIEQTDEARIEKLSKQLKMYREKALKS